MVVVVVVLVLVVVLPSGEEQGDQPAPRYPGAAHPSSRRADQKVLSKIFAIEWGVNYRIYVGEKHKQFEDGLRDGWGWRGGGCSAPPPHLAIGEGGHDCRQPINQVMLGNCVLFCSVLRMILCAGYSVCACSVLCI